MAKTAPQPAPGIFGDAANVALHPTFLWPVRPAVKRRRLPPGVSNIRHVSRLKVGALAEIIGRRKRENNGIRVIIKGFDADSAHCWLVKSLGGPIRCSDGALDTEVYLKDGQLRRLWTGLTANERLQLRLRRAAS
jgi:hypothetical protein